MPFVKRGADGKIEAVYDKPTDGAGEEIAADSAELISFLGIDTKNLGVLDEWMQSDLALARVTEDLIDLLIEKGHISFTELPQGAQQKLIARQGMRSEFTYVGQLFGEGDDDEFI